jgi:hypothetical protein
MRALAIAQIVREFTKLCGIGSSKYPGDLNTCIERRPFGRQHRCISETAFVAFRISASNKQIALKALAERALLSFSDPKTPKIVLHVGRLHDERDRSVPTLETA